VSSDGATTGHGKPIPISLKPGETYELAKPIVIGAVSRSPGRPRGSKTTVVLHPIEVDQRASEPDTMQD